ncbi:MAG: beta-ketoacyl synthase chain length factor [Flavobacteriales bacterium]|nr:beta-ketoacyl synthase chain length factor [Flavobacteriales bacterium]
MYLGAATCISFQDTFGNENPWNSLVEIDGETQLVQPDYKEFVSPAALRRMSSVLKMGAAGGKSCLTKAGLENADAITVGTGLGCVRDTLKFLSAVYQDGEGGLSPTAFIQSTHNSIAGQLALMLGNHGYNMTHVQGALSLGYALSDAELLIGEGDAKTVLVGAVDEKTDELVELLSKLAATANYSLPTVGEGGAFFLASKEKLSSSVARVVELNLTSRTNVGSEGLLPSFGGAGGGFVLSNTNEGFNYTQFSGEHFTSVGFGLFMALKAFEVGKVDNRHVSFDHPTRILVHHQLLEQEMSILLEKI